MTGYHYRLTPATTETYNPLNEHITENTQYLRSDDTSFAKWDDLRVSLSAGRTGVDNPPTYTTFRDGLRGWQFSASALNQLWFDVQLPHTWVTQSTIRPHIHWSPGNSTDTGNVVWALEYSWTNVNGAFPASDTLAVTSAASGTPYAHQIGSLGSIDGTGKNLSSVLMCRFYRDGANDDDTFTGTAYGLSFDFHIQTMGDGSDDEIPSDPD